MNDIIKITELKDFTITNAMDKGTFKDQNVLFIYFRDGSRRIIDLVANTDITDMVNSSELILNINNDIIKKEKTLWKED